MELLIPTLLNALSYGLLLFMLSAGLTLTLGMMGVLNFAHASFYMLGAYLGYSMAQWLGYWAALLLAPLVVGVLGALCERYLLRRVHSQGHVPELLLTFGLSYVLAELVQLVWGQSALAFEPPDALRGPAFTLVHHASDGLQWVWGAAPAALCQAVNASTHVVCQPFAATRALIALVAIVMLLLLFMLMRYSRVGLLIQAALTHPKMVEALGHDVPRLFMLVFGCGAALAALAGVMAGSTFLTEPGMAAAMGSLIFVVVVVGGLGSLWGAFFASLLIGMLQTIAATADPWLARLAPVLPFALLVLVLVLRPRGLLGTREG